MNDRVLSLLGLIRRANRMSYGYDSTLKSVKEKKAYLVLFSCDVSKHTENDVKKIAEDSKVRCITTQYTKEEFQSCLGKYTAVLCINDEGFSQKLISLLETQKIREEE